MTTNNYPPTTRVGHVKSDSTEVYAGRGDHAADMLDQDPGERGWLGNPFVTKAHGGHYTRSESIRRFRLVFEYRLAADPEFRDHVRTLAGTTLGCWCQRLDESGPACHAEVIAEWADRLARGEEP